MSKIEPPIHLLNKWEIEAEEFEKKFTNFRSSINCGSSIRVAYIQGCRKRWQEDHEEKAKRPTIVCLCGSTRFKEDFIEANKEQTLMGKIVLSVGMFGHLEGLDMNGETKKMFDELHKRKIDMCDEVLVISVNGYIGESTRSEIDYARGLGKRLLFKNRVED